MTPKKHRVSKKVLDSRVWKGGKVLRVGNLTLRFHKSGDIEPAKVSFIVPKTAGTAADRNTLRRRGYVALAPHLPHLPPGVVGAMVYNPKNSNEKSFAHIDKLVSEILKNFL